MLHVIDGVIDFNRGDTVQLDVDLIDGDGTAYELQAGDRLILTIRELPNENSPVLLQVENEAGEPSFIIPASDTAELDVGRYSCDIQLQMVSGTIVTVYPELSDDQKGKDTKNWRNLIVNAEVTIP